MKTRHTIYNSIGFGVAALACFSFIGQLLKLAVLGRVTPVGGVGILLNLAMILCIGGGALLNTLRHRFSTRPTVAMIVVYFLTCFLTPLAIWGIVELQLERERRRGGSRSRRAAQPADLLEGSTFPFVYRAANLSWICAVAGFLAFFVCAILIRVKAINYIAIPVFGFAMIFSLVLGTIALFGIRKFGPNRILIPALVGTIISGTSTLFLIAGIPMGMAHVHKRHQQSEATNNVPRQVDAFQKEAAH